MPPGNWLMARCVYTTASGLGMEAILWYEPSGAFTGDEALAQTLAGDVENEISAPLGACLVTTARYEGVAVTLHDAGTSYTATSSVLASNGDVAGDECPDWVAACLRKRGNQAGRSGMGRWFIGGVPETFTTGNNIITGAPSGAYDTLRAAFTTSLAAGGVGWTAAHYSRTAGSLSPIVATSNDSMLARQGRRRKTPLL